MISETTVRISFASLEYFDIHRTIVYENVISLFFFCVLFENDKLFLAAQQTQSRFFYFRLKRGLTFSISNNFIYFGSFTNRSLAQATRKAIAYKSDNRTSILYDGMKWMRKNKVKNNNND